MHEIPLSCTSSLCNLLLFNLGVQSFSHVPPVSVWMPQCVHEVWAAGHMFQGVRVRVMLPHDKQVSRHRCRAEHGFIVILTHSRNE